MGTVLSEVIDHIENAEFSALPAWMQRGACVGAPNLTFRTPREVRVPRRQNGSARDVRCAGSVWSAPLNMRTTGYGPPQREGEGRGESHLGVRRGEGS